MIRYDEHAEFQMERRGIAKVWVEQTIREPEVTQTSGNRRSYFRCVPGTPHNATRGDIAA
jgi:hypothetical protein